MTTWLLPAGRVRDAGRGADLESPEGLHYIRSPDRIRVSPDGTRALETGLWEGRERRDGGAVVTGGGGYTAYWRRVDDRWLIHAEIFVSLRPPGGG